MELKIIKSDIDRIRKYKQTYTKKDLEEFRARVIHESIFRSYSILQRVKEMLNRRDSIETILWIIQELEMED